MKLHCDITLPASKSESNRVLMIAAYGDFLPIFQNLSDAHDTKVLSAALRSAQKGEDTIDIADCGTAARFMTTFLACHEGDWLLTGMERMKQRPMAPLIDALRILGANIQCIENEGYLPLRIKGNPIKGGKVSIDMTQSSQFASSLLLAAPMWSQGIELELLGEFSSMPYLDLTLNMMRHFSAQAERRDRKVIVKHKPYQNQQFAIEPDWTAASYWYEMAAFSEECEIKLRGLSNPLTGRGSSTLQGDTIIAEWMKSFGVCTTDVTDGIVLTKTPFDRKPLSFDFTCCPDLYPTIAATCAGLQIEAQFTGIDNLRLKESDRVKAMHVELSKLGRTPLRFCAHNDHRVVMALAPLALRYNSVTFDHPEVVSKSYPNFWNDIGFWFNI